MKQFIPENLDIEKLLRERPPQNIENFRRDKLIHILHLLTSIPATNKDLEIINGFVPIYTPILQKRIRNYRAYIDYLLQYNIILTDNWYIPGQKSIGYKFTPEYAYEKIRMIQVADRCLINAIKNESRFAASIKKKYKHLIKWYTSDLQIDKKLAMDYIQEDLQRKINNPALLDYDSKTKSYKDPYNQFKCSSLNIERIAAGEFVLSIDDNVFRLHSTLSNLKSEIRNCISYRGRKLVSIDIKNSQPYLSTGILNSYFWQPPEYSIYCKEACINKISKSLKPIIFKSDKYFNSFIMLCKSAANQSGSDLQRYKTLVEQGVFYEYLPEEIGKELGIGYSDRRKVKAAVFQVLFTDNRFLGQEEAKPKKLFKTRFPTVYELFALIKKSDKTNLPVILQRLESHLMLLVITKRIAREQPKLPIFTIHDSIVTTVGNEEYVQKIVNEELKAAVGIAPKLSIEFWEPGNLKFRDSSLFYGEDRIAV